MIKKEKLILIQKDDFKSRGWAKAASENNLGKLSPIPGSPMKMPFVLLKFILVGKKPNAIILRYLNDYPEITKTLLRTITDLSVVLISKLFFVSIFWIVHNVDKESSSYFPGLTHLRRKLLKRHSKYIFVTDEILVDYAVKFLNIKKNKIIPLTFGVNNNIENNNEIIQNKELQIITKWLDALNRDKVKIGLWIGTPNKKILQGLKDIQNICENKFSSKAEIKFIVIGPIGKWLKKVDEKAYNYLIKSENVLFIDRYINIPASQWKYICSFVWNPLSDYSIAYTTYNCVAAKVPIVAYKDSLLGKFIIKNQIGLTLPENNNSYEIDFSNYNKNNFKFETFSMKKTWVNGAKAIFSNVN